MTSLVCKPFEGELADKFDKSFGIKHSFYEFGPEKCLLPPFFADIAQQILDAPVREDDVWLISFPRTGSTWCQEMIWLIGNNMDFEKARNTAQQIRAPVIEMSTLLFEYMDQFKDLFTNSVEFVSGLPSPRFIKSHLPWELLPVQLDKVKPKIIYTLRNPKDLCVSYYFHFSTLHGLKMGFEEFCDLFLQGVTPIGPIWRHYFGFWNRRHEPNILVLKYEDMKKDMAGTVRTIAKFLEKELNERDVNAICDYLSVENMRNNPSCNFQNLVEKKQTQNSIFKEYGKQFIRKATVGDWKCHMSQEMSDRFDVWIAENTAGTDLSFEY